MLGREWSNDRPDRTGMVVEKFKACFLPGVHRPLGASAPGGFHPRPTARHQRGRCHLPLGFPGSARREVTPSQVSAQCWAVPSPASPYLLYPIPSWCNAGFCLSRAHSSESALLLGAGEFASPVSCAGQQVGSSSTSALHGRG